MGSRARVYSLMLVVLLVGCASMVSGRTTHEASPDTTSLPVTSSPLNSSSSSATSNPVVVVTPSSVTPSSVPAESRGAETLASNLPVTPGSTIHTSSLTSTTENNAFQSSIWEVKCDATEIDICAKHLNSSLNKVKCVDGRCRCAENHVYVFAEPETSKTCLPICEQEDRSSFSIFKWLTKIFSTSERCYHVQPCDLAACAETCKNTTGRVKCSDDGKCACGAEPPRIEMAEGVETKPEVGNNMATMSAKLTEAHDGDETREVSKPAGDTESRLMSLVMENPQTTITEQSSSMGQQSAEEPSTTGHPSTTGQTTTGESSTMRPTTIGEQSTTRQTTMGEQSTTRQTTMGEPSTTRQTAMGEPSTTRQPTMGEPSTTRQTTVGEPVGQTMGLPSTMTTAPTDEDSKEAAPSNVDLVDAPKNATAETSPDKNSMQGDQPAEDEPVKSTQKTDGGEVEGVAADSVPASSAAAVSVPTSTPTAPPAAPTTTPMLTPRASTPTSVAPSFSLESQSRASSTHNTPQADQLGGGGNAASTFISSAILLSLGLFSTLQLVRFT